MSCLYNLYCIRFFCFSFFIFLGLIVASCSALSSRQPSKEIKNVLGGEVYSLVANPQTVTAYRFKPQPMVASTFIPQPSGKVVQLDANQVMQLKNILLNDKSYRFNLIKKCIFVAECLFKFESGNQTVIVYLNPSCSQIKFSAGDKIVLLDYDPAKREFQELMKNFQ